MRNAFFLAALLANHSLAAPTAATAAVVHPPPPTPPSTIKCNDVQVFLARGHGESAPGRLTAIVDKICAGEKKCGFQSINYDV